MSRAAPSWVRWGRWALSALIAVAIFGGQLRDSLAAIAEGTPGGSTGSGVSSLTWSHAVASGSNRLLLVRVVNINSSVNVSSVTYGGSALTALANVVSSASSASAVRASMWYLVAPTVGTANVVVTMSGSTRVGAASQSYTGVAQTGSFGTVATSNGSSTTAPSVTVAAGYNDLVVDLVSVQGVSVGSLAGGVGQIDYTSSTGGSSSDAGGGASSKAANSATTMSWTTSASTPWAQIGVAMKPAGPAISGKVFEDIQYGGGAGRSLADSGGSGIDSATVELYSSAGVYITSTTTASDGSYSFGGLSSSTSYHVRVANASVVSQRSGATASLRGVMTYRTNAASGSAVAVTDHVGGTNPALVDPGSAGSGAAFNTSTFVYSAGLSGTAQSVTLVTLAAATVANVDFGFNFDTVVNTNDSGQGSLRQVMTNAVTLTGSTSMAQSGLPAGQENLIFMISNGTAASGLRSAYNHFSGGIATITPTSALPTVNHYTVIDARIQPGWTGNPIIQLNGASAGASTVGFTLGGTCTVAGFIINRFGSHGVRLSGGTNTVQGSWVGLTSAGTAASANGTFGVYVASGSGDTIGGTGSGDGNVLSGNGSSGIGVYGTNTLIQGNVIGLNAAGTAAVPNGGDGISVIQTTGATIGGSSSAARNVISGNTTGQFSDGIWLDRGSGHTVQGNYIGLNGAGTATIANVHSGMNVMGSSNNTIGGTGAGQGNVFAGNTGAGVYVSTSTNGNTTTAATGNKISGNSIYGNGALGIDIDEDGVTANNGTKTTASGNNGMDFPVFTSASLSGTTLTVAGYVGSASGQTTFGSAVVEVFIADVTTAGNGEGKTYLGTLTANASGVFSGTITGVSGITGNTTRITATARDASNNTSEFGANTVVAAVVGISGTVFEDRDYGGGAGRNLAGSGSGGVGTVGTRVELYSASGAYISATTTAADGSYSFTSLSSSTSYHVRVVNSSVLSGRSGATASLVPVMSYRTTASSGTAVDVTDGVGGTNPALVDPGNASGGASFSTSTFVYSAGLSGTAQSVALVSIGSSVVSGVDFGFNFDTVVNTNNSGPGSLRQAITNASTLGGDASLAQSGHPAGVENLVFMISNGTAAAGLRSTFNYFSAGVATIAPTSALPEVTGLVVDAQTQPGWAAAPIVEINGSGAGAGIAGLTARGGTTLRGLVVNRFTGSGVQFLDAGSNVIQGCYIGLNAAGTAASANGGVGLNVYNSPGNTIGGTATSTGNVISGNAGIGVNLVGTGAGMVVQGNTIGLNAAGTARVANGSIGLYAASGAATIGGTSAAARNVIAGNTYENVQLGSAASSSTFQGNYVGTTASGAATITNGSDGLWINGASSVQVGGTAAGAGNVFAGNAGRGVSIGGSGGGNAVLGNSIFGNGNIGIDLANDGLSSNDGAKTAGQPNQLMDHPVFTSATYAGTTLTVAGYVGSAAGQSTFASARVEIFVSDASNPNGQGQTYLGFLTTNASGNFSGSLTGVSGLTTGSTRLTATATDGSSNTSEFGPNAVMGLTLSGTVFEDLNYGGGSGRSLAGSSGAGASGARVELYNASGSYVTATTTSASGAYTFSGLTSATTYFVRVVNSTVLSTRSGSTASLLPVMTYRTETSAGTPAAVTTEVGGTKPAAADAAAGASGTSLWTSCATENATCSFTGTRTVRYGGDGGGSSGWATLVLTGGTSCSNGVFGDPLSGYVKTCYLLNADYQSVATVHLTSASVSGADFGFNFDTVVNTNDSGAGSLRQAITNANTLGGDAGLAQSGRTAGIENLVFMVSNGTAAAGLRSTLSYFSGGVATITPTSALPSVSAALVLDAQTQPGWTANPIVELNGTSAGNTHGLTFSAAGNTVRGLVVNRFQLSGITLMAGSNTVQGCWLGLNAAGTSAAANSYAGLNILSAANTIGGTTATTRNVISGNGSGAGTLNAGVLVQSGSGNVIVGNTIGLNAAGTAAVPNLPYGVDVAGAAATIGGTATGAGNVISGNSLDGIILRPGADGATIQGNLVGANAANSGVLANGRIGITLGANTATVGGTATNAANTVRGNTTGGVVVVNNATGNFITANHIYGNGGVGIDLGYTQAIRVNDGAKTANVPNQYMDHPVFTSASLSGTTLTVAGYVGSAAGQSTFAGARVEVFISDGATANGAGQTYLGFVTADANGNFSGSVTGVAGVTNGSTPLTATATDGSGNTSEFGPNAIPGLAVTGVVFEDTHYGGGAGRSLATSGGAGVSGATVELYNSSGSYLSSTTTGSGGGYSFGSLAAGSYFVRVVNRSVLSQRSGSTASLLPVMTYRTTATTGTAVAVTDFVGGTSPGLVDPASASSGAALNTSTYVYSAGLAGTAQSVAAVTVSASGVGGIDFGFNFNTVVNTNDTGPGSLRQVLTNAEALGGDAALAVAGRTAAIEHVIFMISNGTAAPGLRSTNTSFVGGIASLALASSLPTLVNPIVIDAQQQPGWTATPVVELNGAGAGALSNGLTLNGAGSTVRGLVINRFGQNGMATATGTGLVIEGNVIGLNSAGTAASANALNGILIAGGSATIGGLTASTRNVISGNTQNGVSVTGGTVTVRGNFIGSNAANSAAVANGGSGVLVASSNATVGGTAAGAGNVIRGNGGKGVAIASGAYTGNAILGNAIYGNASLGIDLKADGLTAANDGAQTAATSNLSMDSPVFSSASLSGTSLTVAGYVGSAAGQSTFASARVEIFIADASSSAGQGQTFLGTLNTDASGNFSGTLTGVTGVSNGSTKLTATATDSSNNSSEFGANVTVGLTVSGTVFEDANYGGGAGRSLATAGGAGVSGATVEIYDNSGVFITSAASGSGGAYRFGGLAAGTYHLRVVSSSVLSQRSGALAGLLPVLTFRTTGTSGTAVAVTDGVGGTNPAYADPGAASAGASFSTATYAYSNGLAGTAHAVAAVTVGSASVGSVDFGFNFDTVSNTNASGQGSLAQVLTNANALGGDASLAQSGRTAAIENVVFMIPNGTAGAGLRSAFNHFVAGVATIAPLAALPTVSSPLVIDAQTQPGWTANPLVEIRGSSAGATAGLELSGGSTTVRGLLVTRFSGAGINVTAGTGNTLQGNWIGLDASGAAAANVNGVVLNSGGHQVGGTSSAARNVISGNSNRGLWLVSAGNVVQGNHIGANAAGTLAVGNGNEGVYVQGINNAVGGTAAGAGNLIAGNVSAGIHLHAVANGSTVQGNTVGLNAAGTAALPNGTGIGLACTTGCAVGGTAAGAGNTVSGNSGKGVVVQATSSGNAILVNRVWANGGIAIDLGNDGVTANDGARTAATANLKMDSPVFTAARATGSQLVVAGYVGSAAGQSAFAGSRVEIYASDNDVSGYGGGQSHLGALTADGSGNFSGTLSLPVAALAIGSRLTATATDTASNTSEFGANFSGLVVDLVVNDPGDAVDALAGDGLCATAGGVCTLRAAMAELNAWPLLATRPSIVFALPGCSSAGAAACTITPASALPSVTRSVLIDGSTQAGFGAVGDSPVVEISGAAAPGGTTGLVLAASNSTLRSLTINRFPANGVTLSGSGNTLAGLRIGLAAASATAAPNGGAGAYIMGTGSVIGGATVADRNVIAGNSGAGITVGASSTTISGNFIGTDASGTGGLGNGAGGGGSGIAVLSASLTDVFISANTLANNAGSGVGVAAGGPAQVQILANAMSGNGGLGIDLGNDGVTANTGAANTSLPNNGINMPVITGAGVGGNAVTVYGYIGTGTGQAAFAGARVEFFKAVADGTGYGEGRVYLGFLTADSAGHFSGTVAYSAGALNVGDALTATATSAAGHSSEFGPNWTTTSVAALTPGNFNAFDASTAAGALTGTITSKVAGTAASFAVIALDNSGTALHPGFTGTVSLNWVDARDDSGALSGSCRASWVDKGSAGSATFSNSSRVTVALTPPASGTRAMRLKMTYAGGSNPVSACSNDAFADLPASYSWTGASDADSSSAGTARALDNTAASGGAVHRAGRPFTVRARALDATGALMTGYDGSPVLAAAGCLLPSGCSAAALTAPSTATSAGAYTNNAVSYAEVGALQLQLTDASYADVDAADTAIGVRTLTSALLAVGRFVPDSLSIAVSTNGQLGTANAACMASGAGATFIGQGFGWATAPQVTVTALNAAGATTTRWTGSLMKLTAGSGIADVLSASNTGSASFSASYGTVTVTDLGAGQARISASSTDRFLLDLASGSVQDSVTPTFAWTLGLTDASEAAVAGNPTLAATANQGSVAFNSGSVFHSGRLSLSPGYGDVRSGVHLLAQLQRYSAAGWVTMTEDQGCVTIQNQNVAVETPTGVFTTLGACAAPMTGSVTTRGGRAWLAFPGTPAGAPGRLTLRLAGPAATGASCTPAGAPAALVPLAPNWLLGGASAIGPQALATWGKPQRDALLRRETW